MEEDKDFDDDRINFNTILSLKRIAIVKIVTELCTQPDIIGEILKTKFNYGNVERRILKRVSSIHLPSLLEVEICETVYPIVYQLSFYCQNMEISFESFRSISWTMEGRIDRPNTFLKLPSSSRKIMKTFYTLSKYCLKDDFIHLWRQMSTRERDSLYQDCLNSLFLDNLNEEFKYHLLLYWICYAKKILHKFSSLIKPDDYKNVFDTNQSVPKNMFVLATWVGNVHAAKYFWPQLTLRERNDIVANRVSIVNRILEEMVYSENSLSYIGGYRSLDQECTAVFIFLLSKMEGKEQREVLEIFSGDILMALIEFWPWHRYLLPTIRFMWDFLSEEDFVELLEKISHGDTINRFIAELLMALFRCAPDDFKTCFVRSLCSYRPINHGSVFWKLIEIECLESVQEILRHGNDEERTQMMITSIADDRIKSILKCQIPFLDQLIEEFLSSEYDIKIFKLTILDSWGSDLFSELLSDDNFQKAEQILRWVFTSEYEIENYKKETLEKFWTIRSILVKDRISLLDKFVSWCFRTELEIEHFKEELFVKQYKEFIIYLACRVWDTFLKLVGWCDIQDDKMRELKKVLSSFDIMRCIIRRVIRNFDYAEKLLLWCYPSKEKISEFKNNLFSSEEGIEIIDAFMSLSYEGMIPDVDSGSTKGELEVKRVTAKLAKFYYPLEKDALIELKSKLYFEIDQYKLFFNSLEQYDALMSRPIA